MDKLTEAIKNAYARQSELIKKQENDIKLVTEAIRGNKVPIYLFASIRESVYTYYKPEFERIQIIIQALEEVALSVS